MARKSSKKKNTSLFAISIVILALLIIAIVFLVKKDQILSNFKNTGFFDRVFGTTPEFVQNHETNTPSEQIPLGEGDITINLKTDNVKPIEQDEPKDVSKTEGSVPLVQEKPKTEETKTATEKDTGNKKTTEPKTSAKTELQLCFVYVNPDGIVERRIIKRSVPKSDSPLTNSINLLLKGPDYTIAGEKNLNTYITPKAKLLSAKVQNGVAYLNFNDDFCINGEGNVGLLNQLMQVVYTATTFNTVTSVQFLIEGKTEEYIGDGIWIGSPLTRNSF